MEARSGARIKGIFGWIIKKIAACWNATRGSLWSVALFKITNMFLFSALHRDNANRWREKEGENTTLQFEMMSAPTSGFRAALCHCPWCWINAAIQRPWNRLLELQFQQYMFALQIFHGLYLSAVHNFQTGLSFTSHKEWCIQRHSLQNSFVIHASEHVPCQCCITRAVYSVHRKV